MRFLKCWEAQDSLSGWEELRWNVSSLERAKSLTTAVYTLAGNSLGDPPPAEVRLFELTDSLLQRQKPCYGWTKRRTLHRGGNPQGERNMQMLQKYAGSGSRRKRKGQPCGKPLE